MEGLQTGLFLSGTGGVRMGNAEESGGEGWAAVKTQTDQRFVVQGKDAGGTSPRSLSFGRGAGTALSVWMAHYGSPCLCSL